MRISDWSSDVCSSDLRVISGEAKVGPIAPGPQAAPARPADQSDVLGYSVTDGRAVSVPPVVGANARQDWPSGWVQHRSIRLDQWVAKANRYSGKPIILDGNATAPRPAARRDGREWVSRGRDR